ncbi:MAG: hypothetical protein K2K74_12275 [Lachnospiraceae bacterium]|nr:hypothetical protein [Lachnospiraceae bacterium]
MRIVERVLYGFGGLLALILLFIAICHYNPDLAKMMGAEFKVEAEAGNHTDEVFMANAAVTLGELPAAENTRSVTEIALPGNPVSTKDTRSVDDSDTRESAESKLNVPGKVAGLSGYIPVKATGTEISQSKADEIAKELSKGETGSSLTFDGDIYPYYTIINETQRAIYRQIYANANAQNKHFAPVEDITANDLKNAFTSVVNDHPELFWVDTAYKYQYTPKGSVADITLVFNITANDLESSKSEFEAAAKLITDATYGKYTDYDKEKTAHDTLISRVKYDANAPMNQSAYSALVYGRTVCAGYARALQYVLQQLDIPCYYVTGYAGENHAWNIVKLSDGYYNVDSTWDDTNPNTYDYFNCSDDDYASTHVRRDLSIYLPPCNGNRYSGLEVNPSVTPPANTTPPPTTSTTTPSTNTTTTTTPSTNTTTTTTPSTNTTNQSTATNTESITVITVRGGGDADYIDNIDEYFIKCFDAMIDRDDSVITFDLIITDKKLWDNIYKAYDRGDCQEGYIDRYLVEKHKNACSMNVEAVPRTDGSYLLRHRAVIS